MSNNIQSPSRTALLLGFGGLIPFVGLSSLYILTSGTHQQTLLFSLLAYGATIISFLGAIHWACFFVDCKTYPTFNLSAWLKMRFVLTLIASVSLFAPLAFLARRSIYRAVLTRRNRQWVHLCTRSESFGMVQSSWGCLA